MPYRRAHVAVWLLLGLTLIAFSPGYPADSDTRRGSIISMG